MKMYKGACLAVFCGMALVLCFAGTGHAADAKASATLGNLMKAFDGESNANARYTAFAKKADEEGEQPR